jgi:hypothetical protein
LLLERGTDVHVVNGEGQAPYRVSLACGNGDVAWPPGSEKSLSGFDAKTDFILTLRDSGKSFARQFSSL